jgi:hypothetical protein
MAVDLDTVRALAVNASVAVQGLQATQVVVAAKGANSYVTHRTDDGTAEDNDDSSDEDAKHLEPNVVVGDNSLAVGGARNRVTGDAGVVGGGYNNYVLAQYGSVLGGMRNTVVSNYATCVVTPRTWRFALLAVKLHFFFFVCSASEELVWGGATCWNGAAARFSGWGLR